MSTNLLVKNHSDRLGVVPSKETCPICATNHKQEMPHDPQSIAYQFSFFSKNGRWPNWIDAMAHCSVETKSAWRTILMAQGINVDAGEINPKRRKR